ncbi:MAG: glycosyltransferase [Chitinivibrionales bacterium]|nr:glycosyltransferase [Chitinivibrionales bacterium]
MHVLLIILVVITLYYLSCILFFLRGLLSISPQTQAHNLSFSVVIAAHNEEAIIGDCLKRVLDQSVPEERFEVIIVDDRSTDATADVVASYRRRHNNLSLIQVTETPAGVSPKKHAVAQGVRAARNEIIVFTDADCAVPSTWLATIDKYFTGETGMVQGVTVYSYVDGMNRLFFGLQATDFLSHGVISAAGIGANLPINSNANNFAFRKSVFDELDGYGSMESIISGDDDLLLQRIYESGKWKIRFMLDREGSVTTLPTPTLRGVFEQRKRWGSKTVHYGLNQVFVLSGVFLFYVGIIAALVAGFFAPVFFGIAGIMLCSKLIGEYVLMLPGARMFHQEALRKYILPASIIQLPVVVAAIFGGVFGKFNWKEQRFSRKA